MFQDSNKTLRLKCYQRESMKPKGVWGVCNDLEWILPFHHASFGNSKFQHWEKLSKEFELTHDRTRSLSREEQLLNGFVVRFQKQVLSHGFFQPTKGISSSAALTKVSLRLQCWIKFHFQLIGPQGCYFGSSRTNSNCAALPDYSDLLEQWTLLA